MNKNATKKIFVSGASSDIGLELIKKLILSNYTIIAHYNTNSLALNDLADKYPKKIKLIKADFENSHEITFLIDELEKNLPFYAALFLAAPKPENIRFKDVTWECYLKNFEVQIKSSVQILQKILPPMLSNREGRIIFILSTYVTGQVPSALSHYISAKYALLGLMKSLVAEFKTKQLTFNAISPSMVRTKFLNNIHPRLVEIAKESHPLKRLATVDDIVPLIEFLLSKESSYMNGTNIPIDGGGSI